MSHIECITAGGQVTSSLQGTSACPSTLAALSVVDDSSRSPLDLSKSYGFNLVHTSDVNKTFFLCWVEKKRYFSGFFFQNFSGIFIISCIICISELPAKE